jgi:hypothetical protein
MNILLITILSSFLFYGCNGSNSVTSDASSSKTNSSAPYLWAHSSLPRNLKTSEDFSADERTAIQQMASAWETAVDDQVNFFVTTETTSEISSISMDLDSIGEDGVNGVYRITSWPLSLSTSALAVTQIFGRRFNVGTSSEYVRIEHADILVNENIYDFRTSSPGSAGSYDLRTVLLHELGHFLGLGHKYGDTIMRPSIGTSFEMQAPSTSIDGPDIAERYGVTLGLTPLNALVSGPKKSLGDGSGVPGDMVKILIELHPTGECIHKENGIVVNYHLTEL